MPLNIRYLGDIKRGKPLAADAKRFMALLKNSMRFQGLSQLSRFYTDVDGRGSSIFVKSVFGTDIIIISTVELKQVREESTEINFFSLIYGVEWGIMAFRVSITNDNIEMVPVNLVPNVGDTITVFKTGYVYLDALLNPIYQEGSAVSAIDRVARVYSFGTNQSAQDTNGGMAYELYADKIHRYGQVGFEPYVGGFYADLSEDDSAGITTVYTPFEPDPEVVEVGSSVDAGLGYNLNVPGRRNYEIDFANSKIIYKDEIAYTPLYARIVDKLPITMFYFVWTRDQLINFQSKMNESVLVATLASQPPGMESGVPGYVDLIDPVYPSKTCSGPGFLYDSTINVNEEISYSNLLNAEWKTLLHYKRWDVDAGVFYEIKENLFGNTLDIDCYFLHTIYTKGDNVCGVNIYGVPAWYAQQYIWRITGTRYEVKACLGNKKFLYEQIIDNSTMSRSYQPFISFSWNIAFTGVAEDVHDTFGITRNVYIGDYLFRTDTYTKTVNENLSVESDYFLATHKTTNYDIRDERTYWMDYDYDKERAENGIFFFHRVVTVEHQDTIETTSSWLAGMEQLWDINYTKNVIHTFGYVVCENGAYRVYDLPYTYTESWYRTKHYYDPGHPGHHTGGVIVDEDTGTIKNTTSGDRIWLTSSYISNKEMIWSWMVEDIIVSATGNTITPSGRITKFLNLGNSGVPKGYKETFVELPLNESVTVSFSLEAVARTVVGSASTLRITVVGMNTVNISQPAPVETIDMGDFENIRVTWDEKLGATHYMVLVGPAMPDVLFGGGAPDNDWYKTFITSELTMDITAELMAGTANDLRDLGLHPANMDMLKYGNLTQRFSSPPVLKTPELVPCIGIHRSEVTV